MDEAVVVLGIGMLLIFIKQPPCNGVPIIGFELTNEMIIR